MNNRHGKHRREDLWSARVVYSRCEHWSGHAENLSFGSRLEYFTNLLPRKNTTRCVNRLVCRKDLNRSNWLSTCAARSVFWIWLVRLCFEPSRPLRANSRLVFWTSYDRRRRRKICFAVWFESIHEFVRFTSPLFFFSFVLLFLLQIFQKYHALQTM